VRTRAAAEAYLAELRARNASHSLLAQSKRCLAGLVAHLRERNVRELRGIEERHLASFAERLRTSTTPRGTPLSLASQAIYLQRVRSFFGFLERCGLILGNPAAQLAVPTSSPLPRVVLSLRQAARLMQTPQADTNAGRRDRAILETLYGTAIRRSECIRLDIEDLDLRQRTLLIRNGKGGKDRLLPVPGRAAAALDSYLAEVRPQLVEDESERGLFLTAWWGKRLSQSALDHLLRFHARAAGLPKLHLHALRHTCATHLLRGGADVRHVQAILGHRNLKTTALYTRVVIEDLREVLGRAHPRERGWVRKGARA
jgi:integrase/recombinase XerD